MRTFHATDRTKPHLTPQWVSASNWTYTGTPKKAQALLEVGGAENREHLDPLIPSPGRRRPSPPICAQKTRGLFFGESNLEGLRPRREWGLEGGKTGD